MNAQFDRTINHYLLEDYSVTHDIRLFPPDAHNRTERVILSNSLVDIFDMLSLEKCFFATVESIMRSFWTSITDKVGVVYFYNDCDCEYHGFLDDDYFLFCDEFFIVFKESCLSKGIEMNWPKEYLFAVLAQKKLIIPPHSHSPLGDSAIYSCFSGPDAAFYEYSDFIRIKKDLVHHLYVEYKESHE